jgi:hypothetical protein
MSWLCQEVIDPERLVLFFYQHAIIKVVFQNIFLIMYYHLFVVTINSNLYMIRVFGIDIVYRTFNYLGKVGVCVSLGSDPSFSRPESPIYRPPPRPRIDMSRLRSDQTVSYCTCGFVKHSRRIFSWV